MPAQTHLEQLHRLTASHTLCTRLCARVNAPHVRTLYGCPLCYAVRCSAPHTPAPLHRPALCCRGNKADLSLLVNAAGLDAAALGLGSSATSSTSETSGISGAAAAQQQQHGHGQGQGRGQGPELVPASHVIVDHSEAVWGAMRRLRSRRLQRPHSGSSSSSPGACPVLP